MKLTAYQIVAPLISLLAIVYAWSLVLRRKKTVWEGVFWVLFWGAIAVVSIYPSILTFLSAVTGISSQVNAVFATFLGILFFMVFYLVMRLETLEEKHAEFVRKMALHDVSKNQNTKD